MPLFEYKCKSGHIMEELKPVTCNPDSAEECPICSVCGRLTRLIVSAIARTSDKWKVK